VSELVLIGPPPRIAVDHAGTGTALVFLHGVGGNRGNWRGQLRHFAARYHAIAWDMRGYGDSDDYEGPLEIDDLCSDLERVLDHFGVRTAHLVGLSLGGFILLEFYRRHADRVLTLTLANTNAGPAVDWSPSKREGFVRLRRDPLVAGLTPSQCAPDMVNSLLSAGADPQVRQQLIDSISALRTTSFIRAVERVVEFNSADVLEAIERPTLLIGSRADQVTPLADMRRMQQRIPGSRLVELDGAHLSNIEQPSAFNAALDAFLRETDA
jgi:3-oxoadipate enol-lactonase